MCWLHPVTVSNPPSVQMVKVLVEKLRREPGPPVLGLYSYSCFLNSYS